MIDWMQFITNYDWAISGAIGVVVGFFGAWQIFTDILKTVENAEYERKFKKLLDSQDGDG